MKKINQIVDHWGNYSPLWHKFLTIFIGLELGDYFSASLDSFFQIDSFIITTITNIAFIYLTIIVSAYIYNWQLKQKKA